MFNPHTLDQLAEAAIEIAGSEEGSFREKAQQLKIAMEDREAFDEFREICSWFDED